jgi:pimeloyl-ACP methyl ester carboxylesterase
MTFTQALEEIAKIREQEINSPDINPVSLTTAITHPQPMAKVAVLYHGFTNSPKQFEQLGQQLFEQGYNVYIPRLKYNGHKSRTSRAMKHLTVQDLIDYVDDSIQIAQALGDQVIVMGLSGGGTMALWAGLKYNLKQVVSIAPFIDPMYYPKRLRRLIVQLIRILPNFFLWWESDVKEKIDSPPYAYAWFSTKAIGRFLQVAISLENELHKNNPKTKNFTLVLNQVDTAANPQRLSSFIHKLQEAQADVDEVIFKAEEKIHHDMIDPNQQGQKVNLVYPRIIQNLR